MPFRSIWLRRVHKRVDAIYRVLDVVNNNQSTLGCRHDLGHGQVATVAAVHVEGALAGP